MITDYYAILNVESTASLEHIKKAFRKEIAIYHPENNKAPNAKETFNAIVEAFNVLSNAEKRKTYDDMLRTQQNSKPIIINQKQEEQYQNWKKEAKQKADKSWDSSLTELLLLDLFFDFGFNVLDGLDEGFGDIISDTLGEVLDLF